MLYKKIYILSLFVPPTLGYKIPAYVLKKYLKLFFHTVISQWPITAVGRWPTTKIFNYVFIFCRIVMPKAPAYSPTRPEKALREIKNGSGSLRSIAKKYGIPRATLQFKLKNPDCKTTFGPSPVLTIDEESIIVSISKYGSLNLHRKVFHEKKMT